MCLCVVMVNFQLRLQARIACQEDQFRDVVFKKYKAHTERHFTVDVP